MEDLERVLKGVERDAKRKGGPLKRRFIITEGIFENTGVLCNLPRIVSHSGMFAGGILRFRFYARSS
jgi:7-keto-8-aminopelargonate synthetase-like enzyme